MCALRPPRFPARAGKQREFSAATEQGTRHAPKAHQESSQLGVAVEQLAHHSQRAHCLARLSMEAGLHARYE
jgi:hypothetical protein